MVTRSNRSECSNPCCLFLRMISKAATMIFRVGFHKDNGDIEQEHHKSCDSCGRGGEDHAKNVEEKSDCDDKIHGRERVSALGGCAGFFNFTPVGYYSIEKIYGRDINQSCRSSSRPSLVKPSPSTLNLRIPLNPSSRRFRTRKEFLLISSA